MMGQKYTDEQYLEAGQGYFQGDDLTRNHVYKLVRTRTPHDCMGTDHEGDMEIPVGSKALREQAIDPDVGRITCYVCLPCLDLWCNHLDFVALAEVEGK